MKILLVKCPRAYESHFEETSESLALAYLAGTLRQHDHNIDIVDASLRGLSIESTLEEILIKSYEVIGFTIADPTFIDSTFLVINSVRSRGVKSHITIGGHAPTFHCREVLSQCPSIDSVVMHEGEMTLIELSNCIRDRKDWRAIPGISYRSESGEVVVNSLRSLVDDLDSLPFPSRDTVPYILEHKKQTGVVSMAGGGAVVT